MRNHTNQEVLRVLRNYDPENDMGPDAPVTWREERLAHAILELESELKALAERVEKLETTHK